MKGKYNGLDREDNMERVVIFIHGSNLYHGLKSHVGKSEIDFFKFSRLLCGENRKLVRTYYYNTPLIQEEDPERYQAQQKFYASIAKTPYVEVKLGRMERQGEKFIETGIDLNLGIDMLRLAHENVFDTAVLVSGDNGFVPLVDAVKHHGKNVEHAFFPGKHYHLRSTCDKSTTLTKEMLDTCYPE